eukprot:Nk52_evm40s240 gene=Nk52_evmTU40s240
MVSAVSLEQNLPTEAAQELRCAALKDKKLLWVSCPYADSNAIHKLAKSFGPQMWILSSPSDEFAKKCVKEGIFEGHVACEVDDDMAAVDNAIAAIKAYGVEFDAIYSPHEISIPLVCRLAEEFGTPTNSSESAANARNKLKAREICKEAGLNSPRFAYIKSESEIEAAAEYVKFPAVCKPSSGAGSQGVVRVESVEELKKNFKLLVDDMKEHVYLNWNPGCDDGVYVILEQYLLGDEFDVDCLFWDGECVFMSISDNWPTFEPYFLETGSSLPSLFSQKIQDELREYVIDVVKALGFKMGAFHVETKYGPEGPQLIEVNPRMGGGPVMSLNNDCFNVDLFKAAIMSSCGIPINPPRPETAKMCASLALINSPLTGTVENINFLDFVKSHPYFGFLNYKVEAGQRVTGLDKGLPDWLAEIRLNGPTPEETDRAMKEVMAQIEYPITVDSLPPPVLQHGERRRSSATELF